jgi:hypothetical protein
MMINVFLREDGVISLKKYLVYVVILNTSYRCCQVVYWLDYLMTCELSPVGKVRILLDVERYLFLILSFLYGEKS